MTDKEVRVVADIPADYFKKLQYGVDYYTLSSGSVFVKVKDNNGSIYKASWVDYNKDKWLILKLLNESNSKPVYKNIGIDRVESIELVNADFFLNSMANMGKDNATYFKVPVVPLYVEEIPKY